MKVQYKVSIIVPIYNAEEFLNRCLKSILNQKLDDIQIILVDDGSSDKSLSICKDFAKSDKRIIVIEKSNGGVSSARNAGIEAALGEYVGFVDPDDWIEPDMYENMYNLAKKKEAEVSICNYINEYIDGSKPNSLKIHKEILEKEDINNLIANMIAPSTINSNETTVMGSVWRSLISNKLIKENGIKFNEDIHLMEDLLFLIETLLKCNKLSITNGLYYHYFRASNSAMNLYRKNFYEINSKVHTLLTRMLKKEYSNPKLSHQMNIRYVNIGINSIVNELKIENQKSISEKLGFISKICNDKKLIGILKSLSFEKITLRKRFILNSIIKGKVLFLFVYYTLIGCLYRMKKFN